MPHHGPVVRAALFLLTVPALAAPVRAQAVFAHGFEDTLCAWSSAHLGDPSVACDGSTVSPGIVALVGLDPDTFNAVDSGFQLSLSGATFSLDPSTLTVSVNDEVVPAFDLSLAAGQVDVSHVLDDGLNELHLVHADSLGRPVEALFRVWAGSETVTVSVVDGEAAAVDGATVVGTLVDDLDRTVAGVTVQGQVTFENLPARTFLFEASSGDDFGTASENAAAGAASIALAAFQPASQVANNDFSLGTDGWNVGTAPVQIVPHVEGSAPSPASTQLATDRPPGSRAEAHRRLRVAGRAAPEVARVSTAPGGEGVDNDLVLSTSGEGPQSISRTFELAPGSSTAAVRFRFVTSEVPGGWFGSEYNDSFSIVVRSLSGGDVVNEANSMNALGLGAFDASGATTWREAQLATDTEGDTIQVDVTVTNVGDGLFDSQVYLDRIDERQLAITGLVLRDPWNDLAPLARFSATQHGYAGVVTSVAAGIELTSAADDSLQSLNLEVVQSGAKKATGIVKYVTDSTSSTSSTNGTGSLAPFGDDEAMSLVAYFEFPGSDLADIDVGQNGSLTLRLVATTADGDTATAYNFHPLEILAHYAGSNRWNPRDEWAGGDGWAVPSVLQKVAAMGAVVPGLELNDFANMHGGKFPPHNTHDYGRAVDARFPGYSDRDTDAAAQLLALLQSAAGSTITKILVAYEEKDGDPFYDAIKGVTIGSKPATSILRPHPGHTHHFHVDLN
jgi:hypothetical protein